MAFTAIAGLASIAVGQAPAQAAERVCLQWSSEEAYLDNDGVLHVTAPRCLNEFVMVDAPTDPLPGVSVDPVSGGGLDPAGDPTGPAAPTCSSVGQAVDLAETRIEQADAQVDAATAALKEAAKDMDAAVGILADDTARFHSSSASLVAATARLALMDGEGGDTEIINGRPVRVPPTAAYEAAVAEVEARKADVRYATSRLEDATNLFLLNGRKLAAATANLSRAVRNRIHLQNPLDDLVNFRDTSCP